MKNNYYLVFALLFLIIGINYSFIDSALVQAFEEEYEIGFVERVVDGDTIVLQTIEMAEVGSQTSKEEKVRLLGINSPESGEIGYTEAKNFLIREIEGKEVVLKFGKEKFDRYKRTLAYIFLGNENINLKSVRQGYSSFYFPSGKDKYYSLFFEAWQECLNEEAGICLKSNEKCIELSWTPKDDLVVLENICPYEIDLNGWSIKDEGRKKLVLSNKILQGGDAVSFDSSDWNETYVWTRGGDSIFVRDSFDGLVYWRNY